MSTNPATEARILSTAGPLLVGYLLNWSLFGALSVQVYIYYLAFPKDRTYTKLLVYTVYVLEVVQAVLVAHDLFATFATDFGNVARLTAVRLSWLIMPIVSGIVAFFVQGFYAFRIRTLSKSIIIPVIIVFLAFTQLAGAFLSGVQGLKAGDLTKLDTLADHIGHGLFDATSAVCDVVIAICMAYYLSRCKTAVRQTHNLIVKVTRLTIGTGALTATVAIVDLGLYYGKSRAGFFVTAAVILGKMYSNSMMVMLNSRAIIMDGRSAPEVMALSFSENQLGQDVSLASGSTSSTPKPQADQHSKHLKAYKSRFIVNLNSLGLGSKIQAADSFSEVKYPTTSSA